MQCEEAQGLIDLQVDGALAAPRAELLRAHLAGCGACAKDLAELTAVRGLLAEAKNESAPAGVLKNIWPSLEIAAVAANERSIAGGGAKVSADASGSTGSPARAALASVEESARSGSSVSKQKKGTVMSTAAASAVGVGSAAAAKGTAVAGGSASGGTGSIHPRWRKSAVLSVLMVAILVVCYAIGSGQLRMVSPSLGGDMAGAGEMIVHSAPIPMVAQTTPPADPAYGAFTLEQYQRKTYTESGRGDGTKVESSTGGTAAGKILLHDEIQSLKKEGEKSSAHSIHEAARPPMPPGAMAEELRNKQAGAAGVRYLEAVAAPKDDPNRRDASQDEKKMAAERERSFVAEGGKTGQYKFANNNLSPDSKSEAVTPLPPPSAPGRQPAKEAGADDKRVAVYQPTYSNDLTESPMVEKDPNIKRGDLYAPPTTKPGSETTAGGVGESLLTPAPIAQKPKIIKSGNIVMEVTSYAESSQKAIDLMVRFDGYLADNRVIDLPGGAKRGEIVIRVLPEKFEALFGELKKIGKVQTERAGAQDVTAAFTDTEARIRNLQITEARLQELIKSKTYLDRVEDLLRVEQELQKTRGQIEEMQGQLRMWATLISYSSIHLTLEEPTTPVPSGSLSIEVAGLSGAKETLDTALSTLNGKLLNGQSNKRSDGTLMGTYEIQVDLAHFARMLTAIKGLGRVQDEKILNQPFSNVVPEGSANVPCTLSLVVYEKSAQLPGGSVQVQVVSLPEAVKKLESIVVGLEVTVVSNSTLHMASTPNGGGGTGTGSAQLQLRVRAGHFAALLEALKSVGKITTQNVNGEVGLMQGGTAEMPAMLNVVLTEATPGVKERPEGTLGLEVEKFAAAQTQLQAIVGQYKIEVKEANSRQVGKQMVAAYTLAIHADQIDAAVGALEKLGTVKVRQLKGIGVSDLAKPDPELIGTVVLSLEEKIPPTKPEPMGNLSIETEAFGAAKSKLASIVKEFNIEIEASASHQEGERTVASFTLAMPAAKVDGAELALEALGKVQVRQLSGIGLGDLSPFAADAKGHIQLTLTEKPKESEVTAPGAFETTWLETWRGFQGSLGAILRGFGVLLPWLAVLGLLFWLIRRWWKGSAEKVKMENGK